MLLDERISEVDKFYIRYLNMRSSTSHPSGHHSSSSGVSHDDGKEIGFTRTIAELSSTKEIRGCWFHGKINSILSRNNWAYLCCYDLTCYKKAIKDNGEYFCSKCDVRILEGV